jgi:DNA-binding Lrp family transcriptional regulator
MSDMTQPRVIARYEGGLALLVVAWDGATPIVIHEGQVVEAYAIGRPTFEVVSTDGASGTKARALALLRDAGKPMRNSDIAKELGVAPQTTNAALAGLVREGAVERHGVYYLALGAPPVVEPEEIVEEPEPEPALNPELMELASIVLQRDYTKIWTLISLRREIIGLPDPLELDVAMRALVEAGRAKKAKSGGWTGFRPR